MEKNTRIERGNGCINHRTMELDGDIRVEEGQGRMQGGAHPPPETLYPSILSLILVFL